MHCGRVGGIEIPYTAGPSNVPQKLPIFRPPKEMTKDEIHGCIQEHVEGAVRAVEAGFKIVEVSGIVGYLLSNFISAYTNKRTDEYGGDIQGRGRFMKEILEGIRKAVPSDVAIGIRLCGEELLDDRGGEYSGRKPGVDQDRRKGRNRLSECHCGMAGIACLGDLSRRPYGKLAVYRRADEKEYQSPCQHGLPSLRSRDPGESDGRR